MKALMFIGDRASEAVEATGLGATSSEAVNKTIAQMTELGYKRYRLAKIFQQLDDMNTDGVVALALEIDRDELLEALDQLKEWQRNDESTLTVESVGVIWDHHVLPNEEYKKHLFGVTEVGDDVVELAVRKNIEFEAKVLAPKMKHLFKLSRINDSEYIKNFCINTCK